MHIVHESVKRNKGVPLIGWVFMLSIFGLVAAWASPNNNPEKKYKVEVTLQEANALLYCLDKSNAEHLTVSVLSKLITDQVNAQIKTDDSLLKLKEKPKQDTTKKKN